MNETMARPSGGSVARGIILVLVAVGVGVLLLRSTDTGVTATAPPASGAPGTVAAPTSTAPPTSDAVTETSEAPASTEATEAPESTTTTAADSSDDEGSDETVPTVPGFPAAPASEVSVQVVNSTDVGGAAGRLTDDMKARGYITLKPTNIAGTALSVTAVHYQSGKLLEAQVIAELLGLDSRDGVFRMLSDTSAITDYQEPDVLVILGSDLAS